MADPISNQMFSHDSVKYVFQDPDVRMISQAPPPPKPFNIKSMDKSKKTKNDKKKKQDQGKSPLSKLLGF